MTQKYILSLDIGTSSVKASVILRDLKKEESFEIKFQNKCYYDYDRIKPENLPPHYSQQNVKVIFETIDTVLKQIQFQEKIDLITVCGQMHGCVLWNHLLIEKMQDNFRGNMQLDFDLISDNYDWTDARCDGTFLKTLPIPESYADKISSGFGCATLFWLKRYKKNYLNNFDRCGTIMDWFVCLLCWLDQVPISVHNAHSWGYFNPKTNSWNSDILKEAGFPVHLLPIPIDSIKTVGKTKFQWHSIIMPDIPVMVALGDLQSMLHLALKDNNNSIVLNMGTSAQLCHLVEIDDLKKIPRKSENHIQWLDYYPYKEKQYLLVAASLNGGNVLHSFICFLQKTIKCLVNVELSETEIWNKLFQVTQSENDWNGNLSIKPTLFGERHDPSLVCSINVSGSRKQPTLLAVIECLCSGLIENIFGMMPNLAERIKSNSSRAIKTSMVCTGSVLVKNPILQRALQKILHRIVISSEHLSTIDVKYVDACDADVGCALFASKYFNQT